MSAEIVRVLSTVWMLALTMAVYAYPTFAGPTGGVALPSAELAPAGTLVIAADYYDTPVTETYPIRLLYGISENVEAGAVYGFDTVDVWTAHAKYQFSLLNFPNPFALGSIYADADSGVDVLQVYGAHTHYFTPAGQTPGLAASLGINWTRVDYGLFDQDGIRAYIVADIGITSDLRLVGEYQTSTGDLMELDQLSSAALRYDISDRVTVEAGLSNASPIGVLGIDEHNTFVGAAVRF